MREMRCRMQQLQQQHTSLMYMRERERESTVCCLCVGGTPKRVWVRPRLRQPKVYNRAPKKKKETKRLYIYFLMSNIPFPYPALLLLTETLSLFQR
jgi:hypothetical protein